MKNRIEIPSGILKPARYLGGEMNLSAVPFEEARVGVCLAFPDTYEIGMSHFGFGLLYRQLASAEGVCVERTFTPWADMWDCLEKTGKPLFTVDTGRDVRDFDMLAFCVSNEMSATNLLGMLELSGIPLRANNRNEKDPVVVAGGSGIYNPVPFEPFLDIVFIGDGEEAVLEMAAILERSRSESLSREETVARLARVKGAYAPALRENDSPPVKRRILPELILDPDGRPPLVPVAGVIHDRLTVEIFRGCTRGCRFCQAGFVYRPVREHDPVEALEYALKSLDETGFEEVSLLSLSSGDYSSISWLVRGLMGACRGRNISVALPSLHLSSIDRRTLDEIRKVRRTGFTIAPEAGTERLRRVINKKLYEEEILSQTAAAAEAGWSHAKLYFMVGLPTETEEDVYAIAELAERIRRYARERAESARAFNVTVSVGTFVPKPHTPLQWARQLSESEAAQRLELVKRECRKRGIQCKWQNSRISTIEGILARGDRRAADVIETAYRSGARLCNWTEKFDYAAWTAALEKQGLSTDDFLRERDVAERLPWSHVDTGVSVEYLLAERRRALDEAETPDCREACTGCGVCEDDVRMIIRGDASQEDAPLPVPPGSNRLARRFRVGYSKGGTLAMLGHLEFKTTFERAVRRSGLPIRFSEGFHPQPRISFGPPLPLGVASDSEWLDLQLTEKIDEDEVKRRLAEAVPGDVDVFSVYRIPGKFLSIDGALKEVEYKVDLSPLFEREILTPEDAAARLEAFHAAESVPVKRKSKKGEITVNLKNIVKAAKLEDRELMLTLDVSGKEKLKVTLASPAILGLSEEEAGPARIRKTRTTFFYDE